MTGHCQDWKSPRVGQVDRRTTGLLSPWGREDQVASSLLRGMARGENDVTPWPDK